MSEIFDSQPQVSPNLVQRLLDDDSAAWRELVETYSPLLHQAARRTFRRYHFEADASDIEDAVADTWNSLVEKNFQALRRCLEQNNLLQSMIVITRNRCVDAMRRHKLNTVPLADEHFLLRADGTAENASLDQEELHRAMAALSPRERTLVRLRFLHGRKYKEISQLTGITRNSIGPTLARAMVKLRDCLSRNEASSTWGKAKD